MKICRICYKKKSKKDFYKSFTNFDKLSHECKDCKKKYAKEYRNNHKEQIAKTKRNCYLKKLKYYKKFWEKNRIRYRKTHPWFNHFHKASQRCNNPNQIGYKNYGGRGIKFLLTLEEVKFLWFRDNASQMKKPTIDKIDNDGNYCFENCRFIELRENLRKSFLNRKKKIFR